MPFFRVHGLQLSAESRHLSSVRSMVLGSGNLAGSFYAIALLYVEHSGCPVPFTLPKGMLTVVGLVGWWALWGLCGTGSSKHAGRWRADTYTVGCGTARCEGHLGFPLGPILGSITALVPCGAGQAEMSSVFGWKCPCLSYFQG